MISLNVRPCECHNPKSSIFKSVAVFIDQRGDCDVGDKFRFDQGYKPTPLYLFPSLFSLTARFHKNLVVGATDTSPQVTTPSPENYQVCARLDGGLNSSTTYRLTCTALAEGRYVVVQYMAETFLELAEVQVYEGNDLYVSEI